MRSVLLDLRYGWRALRSRPVFTLAAIGALTLGIGANTAIFTVVETLLLRPLPYPRSEELVMVYLDNQVQGWPEDLTSYPNYEAWRDQSSTLADLAAFSRGGFSLTGGADPERVTGARVGGNFFALLGAPAQIGRWIGADEDLPGSDAVVVLGHDLFQRRFGGDPSIVGREIQVDGNARTVLGVMPPAFHFPRGVKDFGTKVELWVPLAADEQTRNARGALWLWTLGRRQPQSPIGEVRSELGRIAARLAEEFPDANREMGATVVGLHEHLVGGVRQGLWLLMGAVGFVLLISVANVANLQLARAADREREIAVRAALGASRMRVARQMLTESVLLALLGGAGGVALAVLGLQALHRWTPATLALEHLKPSPVALTYTLLVSVVAGLLFGLMPALQMTSSSFGEKLKDGGRGARGRGRRGNRVRATLVVAELALATVLMAGAGLMIRSLLLLDDADPGFEHRDTLTFGLTLPRSSYGDSVQARNFYRDLVRRLEALPGVESASAATGVLLADFPRSTNIAVEGRAEPSDAERVEVTIDAVLPGYFATMGVPVVAGNEFDGTEELEGETRVLVNQELARRFFPDQNPIQRRIAYGGGGEDSDWMRIVGVVADTRRNGFERPVRPESYLPHEQFRSRSMTVVLRTRLPLDSIAPSARAAVWELDRELPITDLDLLEARIAATQEDRRFYARLLGLFSALALLLAAIGIYGVLSYLVAQAVPEIGVRIAFGADPGRLQLQILGRGLLLAGTGIGLGLALTVALGSTLESLLYEVSPTDPTTFLGLAGTLLVIALAACLLPARRAMRVDPMVALRND